MSGIPPVEKLARLNPETIVGVPAGELLGLVLCAEVAPTPAAPAPQAERAPQMHGGRP